MLSPPGENAVVTDKSFECLMSEGAVFRYSYLSGGLAVYINKKPIAWTSWKMLHEFKDKFISYLYEGKLIKIGDQTQHGEPTYMYDEYKLK